MTDKINHILNFELCIEQKSFLILMSLHLNQTIPAETVISRLSTSQTRLIKDLKELINAEILSFKEQQFSVMILGETHQLTIEGLNFKFIKRVPRGFTPNSVETARLKLEQLRLTGFVGNEALIAQLSRLYDKLVIKHTGLNKWSLPANATSAKKSRNWESFKRFHQLIIDRQFPAEPYLEAQFQAMRRAKLAGKVYPYPSMLYSGWAIQNYLDSVVDGLACHTTKTQFLDESQIISDVLKSSKDIVDQLLTSYPELSKLQSILLSAESLSPVYLALHHDYLKHCVTCEQELPEDVARVLLRFEQDVEYKKVVTTIFKGLT